MPAGKRETILHDPIEFCGIERVTSFVWHWPSDVTRRLHVFLTHFDAKLFDPGFFRAAGIACPEPIARSVPKRQAEFFFGRLCSQAALGYMGIVDAQIAVGAMRAPVWPAGVVGSITHCATIAAAVALDRARYNGVGLDIESIPGAGIVESMRGRVVSEQEFAYLRSLKGALDTVTLATLVFSAKESFFKAVAGVVKRYFDFDALELVGIDMETSTITFVLTQSLCHQFQPGYRCQAGFELLDNEHLMTVFLW